MATGTAPTSQKADVRPIGFVLDTGKGTPAQLQLNIRPEDLTISEPSRLSVQQTLKGAWADSWGQGLTTISISGHTGWRRSSFTGKDGMEAFKALRKLAFTDWHGQREQRVKDGLDPNGVKLVLADNLDSVTYVIAPQTFVLRRSRSRPLLFQYQISFIKLEDHPDVVLGGMRLPDRLANPSSIFGAAALSLKESTDKIRNLANTISSGIDQSIGRPAKAFMNMTAEVLKLTQDTVGSVQGSVDIVTGSLIRVATDLSVAGRNIFHTIAAVQSLPVGIRQSCMEVAAAYSNAYCLLRNAFRGADIYEEYDPFYGASNCSSTAGGRALSPLRGENPFYRLVSTSSLPAVQTPEAQAATRKLAQMDVLSTTPDTAMASQMADVVSGTALVAA